MGEILHNMARRKLRTALTVIGIVIGILALTVMGSMTEFFNTLLDNAVTLIGDNIIVSPKSNDFESILSPSDERRIARVPGVRDAIPIVNDTLAEFSAVSFGGLELIYAMPPEHSSQVFPNVTLRAGRWLKRGDDYQAVIGSTLAKNRHLDLGGKVEYRDHDLVVVGIMNETHTSPDTLVMVSIETVRRLLKAPDLIAALVVVPDVATQADGVAARIREAVDNVTVQTPKEAIDQARQQLAIFNVILVSGAVLAVFVGGLAVINTMIMSVNERRHEIGLKKAVGASDGEIVREYLAEAATIGLVGGLIGLLLGWGLASLLNTVTGAALGTTIFTVTPRLAATSLGFAIILGALAGLYPAWNAARLDPVQALRVDS